MGYGSYVEITIQNKSGTTLHFKNAAHEWGEYYVDGDKGNEIELPDLNKKTIPANSDFLLGACGRQTTTSGCQGSFELFTESGVKVAHVDYMSPYGSDKPYFTVDAPSYESGWLASESGANIAGDVLGKVHLVIAHID